MANLYHYNHYSWKFILSFLMIHISIMLNSSSNFQVTYPGFGKFTMKDFFNIKYRPIVLLPKSPEKLGVEFLLFTRKNPYDPEKFFYDDYLNFIIKNFNPKLETKILIHGKYVNPHNDPWLLEMKDAFLQTQKLNVIILDWSNGNKFGPKMVANARVVGPILGKFITKLCEMFHIYPKSFHLLGHSHGAHIAGLAGKYLNGQLGHITALDPGGAFYEGLKDTRARLWHTDAHFVESIHTCASHKSPYLKSGMYETCSHIDIYPNGGEYQPGCNVKQRISYLFKKKYFESFHCNHYRAIEFYLETIIPNPSRATPVAYACKNFNKFLQGNCYSCGHDGTDCAIVGPLNEFYVHQKPLESFKGKRFYIKTDDHHHFFKYQYLVRIRMVSKSKKHEVEKGRISLRFLCEEQENRHYNKKNQKKKQKKIKKNKKTKWIHFDEEPEKYHYGTTYSKVLVTDADPKLLTSIELKWNGKNGIFIDYIDVIPLSYKSPLLPQKDQSIMLRFFADFFIKNKKGITKKKPVLFKETILLDSEHHHNHYNDLLRHKFGENIEDNFYRLFVF